MVQSAATIFRDFVTDGVPSSGAHKPVKAEIREWGSWVEGVVAGGTARTAVASIAELKALDPSVFGTAELAQVGRAGVFVWRSGDYSAQVTADPREGIYVKADAVAASAGAWVRQFDNDVDFRWFGAVGDGVTDDTVGVQAAITASIAEGAVARASGETYLVTSVAVGSDARVFGPGTIKKTNDTGVALDVSGSADVVIEGLTFVGAFNTASPLTEDITDEDIGVGTVKDNTAGSSNITIRNCFIHKFRRHGIQLDKTTGAQIQNNTIQDIRFGAGVLIANMNSSSKIEVFGNRIERTQFAGVQGYVPVSEVIVSNNRLTDAGYWVTDNSELRSDNITLYSATGGGRMVISNNTCVRGGVHNIHIGGDNVTIVGNVCIDPAQFSNIFFGKKENVDPADAIGLVISGNECTGRGRANVNSWGIGIRNVSEFTVVGNVLRNAAYGIEVHGLGATTTIGVKNGVIIGNTITDMGDAGDADSCGIRFRGLVSDVFVGQNFLADTIVPYLFGIDTSGTNTAVRTNITFSANEIFGMTGTVDRWMYGIHIGRGRVGVPATGGSDHIVIESSNNGGISILTPNAGQGTVAFGDPQNANIGSISYDHSTDIMAFRTAGNTHMRLGSATFGLFGATAVARGALAAPTGTATRTTFATGSVTLPQLAERVKAMIDDLRAFGFFS